MHNSCPVQIYKATNMTFKALICVTEWLFLDKVNVFIFIYCSYYKVLNYFCTCVFFLQLGKIQIPNNCVMFLTYISCVDRYV